MNSTTTQSPHDIDRSRTISYVLVPILLITITGIAAAVVMYIRKRRRIDRLRHQLLPVYTYDPSEELNEAEQEILWREEDTRAGLILHLMVSKLFQEPQTALYICFDRLRGKKRLDNDSTLNSDTQSPPPAADQHTHSARHKPSRYDA
uniref:Small integral membrane protein 29 n=1 Tax=Nothobranchius furzeri TaxID=105023 RepID=A0A8C6KSS7_NOTFU